MRCSASQAAHTPVVSLLRRLRGDVLLARTSPGARPSRPTRGATAGSRRGGGRSGGGRRASRSSARRQSPRRRRPAGPARAARRSRRRAGGTRRARGRVRPRRPRRGPTEPSRGETASRAPASALLSRLRRRRAVQRALGAAAVGPGHRLEEQRAVRERAGHRAGMVEAPGERHDAGERDRPAGRLDRRGSAAGGGDAQRPGGVGPRRRGRQVRAASAAAEPPLDPPAERSSAHGLPTWSVVPPAANSCVWRWPRSTMPAAERRLQTSQSSDGHVVQERARGGDGLAGNAVEVLEADRDAGQRRSRRRRAGRPTSREPLVRPRRRCERVLLVDAHPGVDRARIALVAVRRRRPRGSARGGPRSSSVAETPRRARSADASATPRRARSVKRRRAPVSRKRRGLSIVSSSICAVGHAVLAERGEDLRGEVEVVRALAGEVRVADHEVMKHAPSCERWMRSPYPSSRSASSVSDPVGVRIEVGDVEAVEAESRTRVRDGPQVIEVVAVARMGDDEPGRIDTPTRSGLRGQSSRSRRSRSCAP